MLKINKEKIVSVRYWPPKRSEKWERVEQNDIFWLWGLLKIRSFFVGYEYRLFGEKIRLETPKDFAENNLEERFYGQLWTLPKITFEMTNDRYANFTKFFDTEQEAEAWISQNLQGSNLLTIR